MENLFETEFSDFLWCFIILTNLLINVGLGGGSEMKEFDKVLESNSDLESS